MAAKPPLELATLNWDRRINSIRQYGLPVAPAMTIAKTDLQKVTQGGAPITDQEALAQLVDVYSGKNIFAKEQSSGGLLDVLHNAGSDVFNIVQNFPEGVVHSVKDIASPKKWEELGGLLAHEGASPADRLYRQQHGFNPGGGGFDWNSIHLGAQDLSKTVAGDLLPGLWTLSSSWKQKEQHPVQSILDILPFADAATKLITGPLKILTEDSALKFVRDAAGVKEADITPELLAKGKEALQQQGFRIADRHSPMEAIAQGHPFGSLWRATARPYVMRALEGTQYGEAALKVGHFFQSEKRTTRANVYAAIAQLRKEGVIPSGLTRTEQADLMSKFLHWNVKDIHTPEEALLYQRAEPILQEAMTKTGRFKSTAVTVDKHGNKVDSSDQFVEIPTGQGTETLAYPVKHPTTKAYATAQEARATANKLTEEKTAADARVMQAATQLRTQRRTQMFDGKLSPNPGLLGVVDAVRQLSEKLRARAGDSPRLTQALDELDRATTETDANKIAAALTKIRSATGLNSGVYGSQQFERYANYLGKELRAAQKRGNEYDRIQRSLSDAQASAQAVQQRLDASRQKATDAEARFLDTFKNYEHPSFDPLLNDVIRGKLIDKTIEDFRAGVDKAGASNTAVGVAASINESEDALWEKINVLKTTRDWSDAENIVGEKAAQQIRDDTVKSWTDLLDKGYRPLWLSNLDDAEYQRLQRGIVKPISETYVKADRLKRQTFDLSPGVLDFSAAMTHTVAEAMREEGTKQTIQFMQETGAFKQMASVANELHKAFTVNPLHKHRPSDYVDAQVRNEIQKDYVTYDPTNFFASGRAVNIEDMSPTQLIVPKGVYAAFHDMMEADGKLPAHGVYMKTMHLFKFAVLTGPRHLVHIAAGNMVMLLLREPMAVTKLGKAFKIVRAHGENLPEAGVILQHDVWGEPLVSHELLPSAIHQHALSRTLGRLVHDSFLTRGIDGYQAFEGMIADMYRVSVDLQAKAEGATIEEALTRALKTFVDMDNLTPFERGSMRQIFPFWAYTKHILRFALTYPADHPLRAAILGMMVRQLEQDHKSGDPDKIMQLFHLGTPDASGNITAIDMRNFNPFRSMSTVFSMAGFLQGLNPMAQEVLSAVGVNPLSATPELYPKLTVNDFTGGLEAKRPGFSPARLATELVPELGVFDHYVQATDEMKSLAKYSPEAYRRNLFSILNLPFSIATTNIYGTRARYAGNEFKLAQQAASEAKRTANPEAISGYQQVPFEGSIYPTSQVQQYIQQLKEVVPKGVSPNAVIAPPRRRRKKKLF